MQFVQVRTVAGRASICPWHKENVIVRTWLHIESFKAYEK
jgi:hypothetical protein